MKRREFFKGVIGGSCLLLPELSGASTITSSSKVANTNFTTILPDEMKFLARHLSRGYVGKQVILGGDITPDTYTATLSCRNFPHRSWIIRLERVEDVVYIRDIIAAHNI